ncbi:WD40-repeat-containing domain protein [Ochromonadaceae sp. CCMP2298]|nr:WD40-repeat-containing domain protein [Ochromonadaceae sp. CCMP2298]
MYKTINADRLRTAAAQGANGASKETRKRKKVSLQLHEENISSDESSVENHHQESEEDGFFDRESAEAKRLRLAKEYLSHATKGDEDDGIEAGSAPGHSTGVSGKLREERLRLTGELYTDLQGAVENVDVEACPRLEMRGHAGAVTCVAVSSDEQFVYSGSKDNSLVQWNLQTGEKTQLLQRWSRQRNGAAQSCEGEVLAVAVSPDGRYVACGGKDSLIKVFDRKMNFPEVKELRGHRDVVTALAFRAQHSATSTVQSSTSLFSGSLDRCLKHWDLNEMAYVETLFGHQDGVHALDCGSKEKPISASSDRSLRLWKVAEETHLVFRGHKSSIDCVRYLTDTSFVSGGQDGMLHLWKDSQKTPVKTAFAAHGYQSSYSDAKASSDAAFRGSNPRWIASLATVRMSNLVASGSNDGQVRLWIASAEERVLYAIKVFEVPGFVNQLVLTPRVLVAGTGKEHKDGRWWSMKGNNLNKVVVIRLGAESDGQDEGSDEEEDFRDNNDDDDDDT